MTSDHYLYEAGKEYFNWQNIGGFQRGKINARKFRCFIKPTDRVLDFGCGNGSLLYHLECAQRIGIEINPAARSVAIEAGLEVHKTLATVPDSSVDVVISNHVLEHTLSPLQVLQLLQPPLISKGRLVFCLPIDDWRTQQDVNVKDINHHLYTWTPLLFSNLLREANYLVERVWVYSHAWPPKTWNTLDNKLPVWLFDLVCKFTAWRYKRRQIMALARKP